MTLTVETGMAGREYVQSPRTTSTLFGYYRQDGRRRHTRTVRRQSWNSDA